LHANPLQNSPTFINFNVLCTSRPRVFPEWHLHCHCTSIQKRPRGLKTASPREQFVNCGEGYSQGPGRRLLEGACPGPLMCWEEDDCPDYCKDGCSEGWLDGCECELG